MKHKILLLIAFVVSGIVSQAQLSIQGTIVNTSTQRASIYIKPTVAVTNRQFLQVAISISIPDQGINNPVVTIDSTFVPNLAWTVPSGQPNPRIFNSRAYYVFYGDDNNNGMNTSWTTGNNKFLTLGFSNTNGLAGLTLNDELPGGGPTGTMLFYVLIIGPENDITNYPTKFYGTNPLPVNNDFTPSFVGAQPISILPVIFKDFNVAKQGNNDALLTWTTSMEQNVSHFIVERSLNQSSGWTKFAEVKAKGNSNTPTKYSQVDTKIYDGRETAKLVFYRIRSVDLDSRESLFPVRSIRFSATGGKQITIYPNPAKDGFYLSVPLISTEDRPMKLNLVNRLGQLIHTREISSVLASNYYYDIKTPGVVSGEYMLQIIYNGDLLETKKVIVQR